MTVTVAGDLQADRNAVHRDVVDVVGGAVEWIDDPDQSVCHDLGPELLADHSPARDRREESLGDHPLGGAIDLGHEVPASLKGPAAGIGRPLDRAQIAARARRGCPGEVK